MIAFWDLRKFAKGNPDVGKLLEHLVDLLTEEADRRSRALPGQLEPSS